MKEFYLSPIKKLDVNCPTCGKNGKVSEIEIVGIARGGVRSSEKKLQCGVCQLIFNIEEESKQK